MKQSTPPRFFHRFFQWYCHPKLRDHIEGDLIEVYNERLRTLGKRKADRKFIVCYSSSGRELSDLLKDTKI